MVPSAFSLGDFLRPVPCCLYPTTGNDLIVAFGEQSSGDLVLVDADCQALGLLSGTRLLAYLGARSPILATSFSSLVDALVEREEDILPLLEPILFFQANTPISEFLSQMTSGTPPHYGVVNQSGVFLGLIDFSKLLKALKGEHSLRLPYRLSSSLQEIFDPFPLPIMVQSESNFILYQNSRWQAEVGEQALQSTVLLDEDTDAFVAHANYPLIAAQLSCAQWLEHRSQQPAGPGDNVLWGDRDNRRSQHPEKSWPEKSWPEKIESEKIWQFIKCPFQWSQGTQSGWLTVAIDLTLSHQTHQELTAKNQDLIQLNRLKDEFFASISHEIKSPVTTIVGLSSLLRDHPGVNLNPRQREYVDLIVQNGRQLMTLVNDLLDLTGLETGQMALNYAVISVQDLCGQVLHLIQNKYRDRVVMPLQISLEIAANLPTLRADELRLRQILVYLLDNAAQATIKGGHFGLKVKPSGQWLTFTIWDTGMGIAESSQPFVFERIHPSTQTWVPAAAGMGLGLVLAQRLAQAQGGDISFGSKEGQGSQFTLILPLQATDGAPPEEPKRSSQGTGREGDWVLVVDAIAHTLEALSSPLTELGYAVMVARTGLEAIEKARRLQPKAIFLNPNLPLLSGWDVLTLLKSAPETRHITVILTQNPAERPLTQTFSEDSWLSPPYSLESLSQILQQPRTTKDTPTSVTRSLTILHLFPTVEHLSQPGSIPKFPFDLALISQLSPFNHRILEADDLEQAEMLTQVWEVDVVVLDGRELNPAQDYLIALSQCPRLATLPLVILDLTTAEMANQVRGLTVFPCLLAAENPPLERFWQVLQMATSLQGQDSAD